MQGFSRTGTLYPALARGCLSASVDARSCRTNSPRKARDKECQSYRAKQPTRRVEPRRGWTNLLATLPAVSPEKLDNISSPTQAGRSGSRGAIHITDGVWVEIGAGHGEMTSRLARNADRVIAIE